MHEKREHQTIGVLKYLLPIASIPPSTDLVTTSTKCQFISADRRRGVMPHVLSKLLRDRKEVKAKMKDKTISPRRRRMLDMRQTGKGSLISPGL